MSDLVWAWGYKVEGEKRAYYLVEEAILLIKLIEDVVEAQTKSTLSCRNGMNFLSKGDLKSMIKGKTEAVVGRRGNELEMGADRDERGEDTGTPLQYSCLEIPWTEEPGRLQSMGSLRVDTTEQLHFHFSLACIGEGNGNPLQCSCLEDPRDGEAWWATPMGYGVYLSMGSHRVGHD